jgi:hypothetical protein
MDGPLGLGKAHELVCSKVIAFFVVLFLLLNVLNKFLILGCFITLEEKGKKVCGHFPSCVESFK